MARDDKQTLAPRLRFPEFRDNNGWVDTILGQLVEFQSGGTPSKSIPAFWNGSIPWVTAKDMKQLFLDDTEDHITSAAVGDGANRVPAGTVLMLTRGMTLLKDVPICILRRPMSFNQDVKAIRPKEILDSRFLPWLLLGSKERLLGMVDIAGHGTGKLNTDELKALGIAIPPPAEQLKIADCLKSLDELISAQRRKVTALKAQKKGLMQHLFPREGETLPPLRFPEFRDAPHWEERKLGQVIEVASGQVDPTEYPYCDLPHVGGQNIESETGNLLAFRSAREDGVISGKYPFDGNDVLYSKIRPALNKVAIPNFMGVCSADIYPIRPSGGDIRRDFLVYLLRSELFVEYATKHSARGKIPKINREALFAYGARLPQPAEQQRIADCLSSLDARIAAETKRFAAFKTHKQGLMQQLFPSSEGD